MKPYYEDGSVTIYHGDARDSHLLSEVACVVTSPPYNTLGSRVPDCPTGMHASSGWLRKVTNNGYVDDMAEDEYCAWQVDVSAALGCAVRPGGSMFYNHKPRHRDKAVLHPLEIVRRFDGWTLRQEIIWARDGAVAFNARMFAPNDERIYWMVRDGADHNWNQDAASWLTIWHIRQEVGSQHPAPFPIGIPSRCIAATTSPGEMVLDPFMGSGTTLVAAKNLGRRSIGIEIEERFCEMAAKRCSQGVMFTTEAQ